MIKGGDAHDMLNTVPDTEGGPENGGWRCSLDQPPTAYLENRG